MVDDDTHKMPEKDKVTIIDGVYVLKGRLGQGGMATVYLAEVDQVRFDYTLLYAYTEVQGDSHLERRRKAEELAGKLHGQELDAGTVRKLLTTRGIPVPGKQVALKVAIGEADTARFEVEWKSLLCLNHPNVIQVYGGGLHLGRPYYAMELLERIVPPKSVKEEFTIAQKLQVIIQAARGLAYLHANGIVHRDVKPDNAVVCEVLPGEFVTKITDLGIAKELEMQGTTLTRNVMGTPHYMSPEQVGSSKHIDHRADIYSLGATLYELVAGVRPYHDKTTVFEILQAIALHTPPLPVSQHNPDLPEAVIGIIECAMAWDPDCRYQKMEELIRDIERYLADEHVEVTRAVTFSAGSKAKSTARIGKGKYAFERYRRKAALRASMPQPRPAGTVTPVPALKKPLSTLLISSGIAVTLIALIAGIVIVYQATHRPPLRRPVTALTPVPAKPPAVKSVPSIRPPTVPTPFPAPAVTGEAATLIASLHAALKAKNPDYNGKAVITVTNGKITKVALMKTGVRDLSPLRGLALTDFSCMQEPVTDLSPLQGQPLTYLQLAYTQIRDLTPLKGMRLSNVTISLSPVPVQDLAPLRGMPIQSLCLLGLTELSSLEPLRGMPSLSTIDIRRTGVRDLRPLEGLKLITFRFTPANITAGIEVLRNMSSLEMLCADEDNALPPAEFWKKYDAGEFGKPGADTAVTPPLAVTGEAATLIANLHVALKAKNPEYNGQGKFTLEGGKIRAADLSGCGIRDAAPLKGLPLWRLDLQHNPALADLGPLAGMPLDYLNLGACVAVQDLRPLAGMRLKTLSLPGCERPDSLEPLRGMPLSDLRLAARRELDLSPLADSRIEYLSIDCGQYTPSLAVLRNLPLGTLMLLDGRELPDLSPFSGRKIDWLLLRGFQGNDLAPLRGFAARRLELDACPNPADVTCLNSLDIESLILTRTTVTDLSALANTRLRILGIRESPIRDLAFVRNLPKLEELYVFSSTADTDLTPLAGLKLKKLGFYPATVAKGIEVVRGMTTLTEICALWDRGERGLPPAEFWKKYDAGEFGKPALK